MKKMSLFLLLVTAVSCLGGKTPGRRKKKSVVVRKVRNPNKPTPSAEKDLYDMSTLSAALREVESGGSQSSQAAEQNVEDSAEALALGGKAPSPRSVSGWPSQRAPLFIFLRIRRVVGAATGVGYHFPGGPRELLNRMCECQRPLAYRAFLRGQRRVARPLDPRSERVGDEEKPPIDLDSEVD